MSGGEGLWARDENLGVHPPGSRWARQGATLGTETWRGGGLCCPCWTSALRRSFLGHELVLADCAGSWDPCWSDHVVVPGKDLAVVPSSNGLNNLVC